MILTALSLIKLHPIFAMLIATEVELLFSPLSPQDFHLSRVFGSGLYLPLCPLPATNALFVTSYGLVLPVLAIITIFVYIIRYFR